MSSPFDAPLPNSQAPEEVAQVIRDFADYIAQETLSLELVAVLPGEGLPKGAYQEKAKLEGHEVVLGVKRVSPPS